MRDDALSGIAHMKKAIDTNLDGRRQRLACAPAFVPSVLFIAGFGRHHSDCGTHLRQSTTYS
jgi:hypothetical protein